MLRNRRNLGRLGGQLLGSTHCLMVHPPYPGIIGYLATRNRFSWSKRVA